MSWVAAVKEFNAGRGGWILPKKGSSEYDEVKKIQERLKADAPQAPPKKAKEGEEEKPKRERRAVTTDEDRPKRVARPKKEKPPTEPTKPDQSKTRVVEKSDAGAKKVENSIVMMDMAEIRRMSAPAPAVKPSGEPLKAKSKDERVAEKEAKKAKKLELVEVRSQLAKAKIEKNREAVDELSKKVKDLKIALL